MKNILDLRPKIRTRVIEKIIFKRPPLIVEIGKISGVILTVLLLSWGISTASSAIEASNFEEARTNFNAIGIVSEVTDNSVVINEARGTNGQENTSYTLNVKYIDKIETNNYEPLLITDIKIGDKVIAQGVTDGKNYFITRLVSFGGSSEDLNILSETASTTEDVMETATSTATSTDSSTASSTEEIAETDSATASTTEDVNDSASSTLDAVENDSSASTSESIATSTTESESGTSTLDAVIETTQNIVSDVIETATEIVETVVETVTEIAEDVISNDSDNSENDTEQNNVEENSASQNSASENNNSASQNNTSEDGTPEPNEN